MASPGPLSCSDSGPKEYMKTRRAELLSGPELQAGKLFQVGLEGAKGQDRPTVFTAALPSEARRPSAAVPGPSPGLRLGQPLLQCHTATFQGCEGSTISGLRINCSSWGCMCQAPLLSGYFSCAMSSADKPLDVSVSPHSFQRLTLPPFHDLNYS